MAARDLDIYKRAIEQHLVVPFEKDLLKDGENLSHGLASYGYDVRLDPDVVLLLTEEMKEKMAKGNVLEKDDFKSQLQRFLEAMADGDYLRDNMESYGPANGLIKSISEYFGFAALIARMECNKRNDDKQDAYDEEQRKKEEEKKKKEQEKKEKERDAAIIKKIEERAKACMDKLIDAIEDVIDKEIDFKGCENDDDDDDDDDDDGGGGGPDNPPVMEACELIGNDPIADWVPVDPKILDQSDVETPVTLETDSTGTFFYLPPHTYARGKSMEEFKTGRDMICWLLTKQEYATCGIMVNTRPIEPEHFGPIIIEFYNSSPNYVKIYVNEGVAQVLFEQGWQAAVSLKDRGYR